MESELDRIGTAIAKVGAALDDTVREIFHLDPAPPTLDEAVITIRGLLAPTKDAALRNEWHAAVVDVLRAEGLADDAAKDLATTLMSRFSGSRINGTS